MTSPLSQVFDRRRIIAGLMALGAGACVQRVDLSDGRDASLGEGATLVAHGLAFPEGLFTYADGALGCVEIAAGTLLRFDGAKRSVVARSRPGLNGAARLPDGRIILCDNGGLTFERARGIYRITGIPDEGVTGAVLVADPTTGRVWRLYDHSPAAPLNGPNDCVWDGGGGFWFTDTGKNRKRGRDPGALYWAACDGSDIVKVLDRLDSPNGVVLDPSGRRLHVALSAPCRILTARIDGPAALSQISASDRLLDDALLDNIVCEQDGGLVAGCVRRGGVLSVAPAGELREFIPLPDFAVTALCFGGADMRTLFVALSTTGRIVSLDWPRIGVDRAARSGA